MEHVKTIGIIGAGISGLVTAKTCLEYGYTVMLFEKDKELGGVWSSSRRYPGITTQNTKDTYCFTDFIMPEHYPQWPSGGQMQSYLTEFAKKFKVFPQIHFSHEITSVDFKNNKWVITGKNGKGGFTEQTDFLIVCNGTFSDPYIPEISGMDSFIKAGGEILHSTKFQNIELSRNKRIIVLGYNKSASDVVTAASETAKSTHLVFREAKWKLPPHVKGIKSKYLFLNRLGEALVKPDQHTKLEAFVHKLGMPKKMLSFVQNYIRKKQMLNEIGLVPSLGIKDQVFGEITMETPHFFERIRDGKIIPKKGSIASFQGKQVTLTSGEQMECDLVVFGTGFRQTIPFLPDHYMEKLLDKQGNYILYHHILPAGIPALAFVGYNSSLYTTLTSEFAALWVCEYLKERIAKPTDEQIITEGREFIKWRSQFRMNSASRGLSTMPGTIHHLDMLLKDMNAPLPFLSLIPDWLVLTTPTRYKKLRKKILERNISAVNK